MYRYLFILLFIGILYLIVFVNGLSLLKLLSCFFKVNRKWYWVLFTIVNIALLMCTFLPNRYLQFIGGYFLGFTAYYFMFNIVLMFIMLLPVKAFNEKMFVGIMEGMKLVLISILIGYGAYNLKKIEIISYELYSDKVSETLTIVAFADLHLGSRININEVKNIVTMINDMDADLVLIPGDFINISMREVENIDALKKELRKIKSKYGVYVTLGNHDPSRDHDDLVTFFKDSNIILLEDEIVELGEITIVGRRDLSPIDNFAQERKKIEELVGDIDNNQYIIMPDHQPNGQRDAIANNVDLLINGHTHNGQIFPGNLIVAWINLLGYGHKKYDNTDIIVTSGVGYWGPPIRIGSHSEIVKIELNPSKS